MTHLKHASSFLLLLAVASLTACVPWKRERAAYADLCETEHAFKVPGLQGETTVHLETYLYDYPSRWRDQPFQQLLHVQYPGEKYPRPEFYVQLVAYNEGGRGAAALPIVYDSREAYITFEDGSQLKARPEVYLGGGDYDAPVFHPNYARPSPYAINSEEVQKKIARVTNNKRHGSAYVIFPTDKFNADAKWTIHLGTLDVQGRKVQIPPLELCHHPVKQWIGIEPLMRP